MGSLARPEIDVIPIENSPANRNSGIGSLLITELKRVAGNDGFSRFHLFSASRKLDDVVRFYARHGFQVWSVQAYGDNAET
jgi:GNAT superfamily N-acetyltransferase